MAKKYYKTTVSIDVLTEEPIPDVVGLDDIAYQINEGDWVGYNQQTVVKELTGKEVVDALNEAGSDASFFMLDDNGDELP